MILLNIDVNKAKEKLENANGWVRKAIDSKDF